MAASIRTYNLETPEHLSPEVLTRLALKALLQLQQEQQEPPWDCAIRRRIGAQRLRAARAVVQTALSETWKVRV